MAAKKPDRTPEALALVAAGQVKCSVDSYMVMRLHGAGSLSDTVWKARMAGLVKMTALRGSRTPVELTDKGRAALAAAVKQPPNPETPKAGAMP